MSNNPGKRGKPAPWERRAKDHEDQARDKFLLDHHPEYAEWDRRRSEAFRGFSREEEAKASSLFSMAANKEANRRLKLWDKQNPSPMTFEEHQRLTAEFRAEYERPDFS